jgi:MFS family permease
VTNNPGAAAAPRTAAPSPLQVLRNNREIRRIWCAQVVSETGDWLTRVAIATHFANQTNQSALATAGIQALMIAPFFVVSPLAGVLADKLPRRSVLIGADSASCLWVWLYLLAFRMEAGWLGWAFAGFVVFVHLSLAACFEAARTSLIAVAAKPEELASANTLTQITWSVCLALGSALSGLILHVASRDAAVVLDSVSFLLGVAILLGVRAGRAPAAKSIVASAPDAVAGSSAPAPARAHATGSFAEGLRYLRSHPTAMAMLVPKLMLGFVGMNDLTFALLGPRKFGVPSEESLSLYFIAVGAGTLIGPPLASLWTRGESRAMRRAIAIAFLCEAAIFSATLFAESLLWTAVFAGMATAGGSVIFAFSSALLQRATPDRVTGRAVALDFGFLTFTNASSLVLGGSLVEFAGFGPHQLLFLATCVYASGGFVWLGVLRWGARREWDGDRGRPQ